MTWLKKALDIVPTSLASRAFGIVSDIQFSPQIQHYVNAAFAFAANINMDEAEKPMADYVSLNDIFTRQLKANARTIATADVVSPVDGTLSFMGRLQAGSLIEAKGRSYQAVELVATQDPSLIDWLGDAWCFTIYLSPRNYHRIHMPIHGEVSHFSYAPGRLLPVNRLGYWLTDDLLPCNERLTSFMRDERGHRCALVKVGATCVGRISTVYDDFRTNDSFFKSPFTRKLEEPWAAKAGDPLACFELGSTVVLFVSGDDFTPDAALTPKMKIAMGQALGNWKSSES